MTGSLLEDVRAAAAAVAGQATLVRIDRAALHRLAGSIDPSTPPPMPEETWNGIGTEEDRAMAVLAWNAVNFGSGWFPHVRKLPGRSGARTMATRWQVHCRSEGVPTAPRLRRLDIAEVAQIFGQPVDRPIDELMAAFTASLHGLGQHLVEHHGGSAADMVLAAAGSGAALAAELAGLPLWDDRHRHGELDVPLYKRAQIAVSNLATEFGGQGIGAFHDLDRLTCFADNLVPHVLRMHDVLVVDPALEARIEREELLRAGEPAEVELRALGVHAVELLVGHLHAAGRGDVTAATLDHRLWQMGQDPAIKARPRHRCRCTYY